MDDVEDDARYPPNPYHPSHARPKPPSHPQFSRRFSDQPNSDDEASNSDEVKHSNLQKPPIGSSYMDEDEDEDDDEEDADPDNNADDDETSSLESRGKRMKLDNFEFVPRKPPTAMTSASPHPPSMSKPLQAVKNSPPDWSEDSTFVLLESWGDLFVKNGRKSLRSDEWSEVAKKVNQDSRTTRSDSQCRNRVDTLKKKYKKEKARMAEHVNFKSDWIYFKKMDSLMTAPAAPIPTAVPVAAAAPRRLACGVDAGEYIFANNKVYLNRANAMDEMRDSPGDTGTDDEGDGGDKEDDESDGLPPTTREKKRGRGGEGSGSGSLASYRMLAESIQKFGEVYERIESSRRKQMVEMERMRKEFHRDLEAQKRQILERAQAEIARIRQEEGEEEEERMTGDDDEDDEVDGSAENLSG